MLLIHTHKVTPRVTHAFKHICTHILGIPIKFTNDLKEFIAHEGAKFSYGKEKLGNEIFVQNVDLLFEQGINDLEIKNLDWEGTPCFFPVSENSSIPFDIFAASFYLVSRYEEYLPHVKDEQGRFPAMESLACSFGFIKKPVVDIWAIKFFELLKVRFPDLQTTKRRYSTNNIIRVTRIFKYRKKGILRTGAGMLKNLVKLNFPEVQERLTILLGLKEDPYNVFEDLIAYHKKEKVDFHFMFQLSDFSTYDKNINHNRKYYKTLIKFVGDYCQVGLRLGYFAKDDLKVLKKEKNRLEAIINRPVSSAVNTQFNLLLPNAYNNLAELEVKEDYSMGYPDTFGFRAGTCTPFMFYDLNFEITTPLLVVPYIINSKTPLHQDFSKTKKGIQQLIEEVKKVNGTFTSILCNEDFSSEEKRRNSFEILKMINEKH